MSAIPIIGHADPGAVLAYRGGETLTAADFLRDVERLAQSMPARSHLVNLCVDRYRFAVGLAAALVRGQTSLLPPNQTPEMLRQLRAEYGTLYALVDGAVPALEVETLAFPDGVVREGPVPTVPHISDAHVAAIAFTSGSTGTPTAHAKAWGALARGAAGEAQRFGLTGSGAAIVSTVPPQHMYGLESSVLMALCNGLALHAGRPFFPADVHAALLDTPSAARVLVTTPVHLRALMESDIDWPSLRLAVCATAPLSPELARQAEARFRAPLREVYGFTEAGMVATRRTIEGARWHCLPDVRIWREGEAVLAGGGHVDGSRAFSDVVEVLDESSFLLHGRSADMVNIAGKRTSLAYLNHQLNSMEGVLDGVFFMPEESGEGITRPVAFAVAPGRSREDLLRGLRERIDEVFLPRPLHLVEALPRNATGKLQREALVALAGSLGTGGEPLSGGGPVTLRVRMAADHPALAGHFPGDPIVPGVVLLDEILGAAVRHGQLPSAACVVRSAKFVRPVRPGEELTIALRSDGRDGVRFECSVEGATVVSGLAQPAGGER